MTIERDVARRNDVALGAMPEWPLQLPMIVFTAWWNAAFDAWHPQRCPRPAEGGHDLAVPDPIEREGEHALFA